MPCESSSVSDEPGNCMTISPFRFKDGRFPIICRLGRLPRQGRKRPRFTGEKVRLGITQNHRRKVVGSE